MHLPDLSASQILLRVRADNTTGSPSVSINSCLEENFRGSGLSSKAATGAIHTRRTVWEENLGSSIRAFKTEDTVVVDFSQSTL